MEKCKILNIQKNENVIKYEFEVSEGLKKYFSGKQFVIEYPENIEDVPDSIAVVPFVCNVIPIIWLTNSMLVLSEIDQAFYECIPNVKKGYETMFPESCFLGEISVSKVIPCEKISKNKCAAFYSGGVDSMQTLLSHVKENPALISIWGSDIQYNNTEGWNLVHKAIEEATKKYNLQDIVIRSTFREFDNEILLHQEFSEQLKDGWWHGVKHGIGLLGHVAPYAYLHGLAKMYIASSNCPADGTVRCASHPMIDNEVRFADCVIIHDGFEFNRQDKIRNIVEYNNVNKRDGILPLHVCWESQTGDNCCQCEKCYRTMAGIIAEQANPMEYGFYRFRVNIKNMKKTVLYGGKMSENLSLQWIPIKERISENRSELERFKEWKYICWIEKTDFTNIVALEKSFQYRILKYLRDNRIKRALNKIKVKLEHVRK